MSIVVQKYGGTSLRNLNTENNILTHMQKSINEGNHLIIVVSAIGRKGDPYATDTLIEQLEQIDKDINPKKKDLIMSCGETISAAIVSHHLDRKNIPSEPLTGFQAGIFTDDNFNSSNIIDIDTSSIMKFIKEDKVVVVAGFQGITKDMQITTLGRGGSDTTAMALARYLNADRVEIFTDVPGVALIDPVLVPHTKYIKNISYDNMYKLASNGVKVIHPRAILIGKKFNIPIRITSTYLDTPGTLITDTINKEKILGIAIKEQNNGKNFSIFFNEQYQKTIKETLEQFLDSNKEKILDITYFTNKVSILIKTNNITQFARNLYSHLFK